MANNQILASDYFLSGSLAAGWSAAFGSVTSAITASSPHYAEPRMIAQACDNVWTGLTWPNDQISEFTIATLTTDMLATAALWVRLQSGSLSGYVVNLSDGNVTIYRCDSGSFTQLATVGSITFASGDIWTFEAAGAALTVYQNQKKIVFSADATYTSGSPGFRQNAATGGGSSVTHTQVASWRGYALTQQDGIWQRGQIVLPALSGDIALASSTGSGVYQLSNLLYEGNAQLLSGTVYKGWFTAGGSPGSIYYGESLDGLIWTREVAAVISGYANPFVIKVGTTYYLYCQSSSAQGTGDFALYTSTDGVTWSQQSTTILAPGTGGAWDATSFFDFQPVAIIAGTWYALYTGGATGGNSLSTGLATSSDGLTWTKYASNPVLSDVVNCGAIAQIGSSWYMWAGANQPGQFSGTYSAFRPFEVVRYKTTDFKTWTVSAHSAHHSQMFEALNFNAAGAGGAFPNAIINVNGKAYLYIQGSPLDGVVNNLQQISVAIAPASIASIVTANEDGVEETAVDAFTSGAGSLDGNWTTPTGGTALKIVGTSPYYVEPTTTSTLCQAVYIGASYGQNQYSEVTLATLSGTLFQSYIAPMVLASTTALTDYEAEIGSPTATSDAAAKIYKRVAGTPTQIGPTAGCEPQVGDVWRLSVVFGSDGFPVLSLFQNGFLILQVQDQSATPITSGNPGMAAYSSVAIADAQISLFAAGNANVIPAYPSSGGNFAGYGTDISASTEFTSHPAGEINSSRTSIFGTNRGSRIIG